MKRLILQLYLKWKFLNKDRFSMKKIFVSIICCLFLLYSKAQETPEVYPTNWWVNMKLNKIQLLIHSKDISSQGRRSVSTTYPGIKVLSTEKLESPNYLVANLEIASTAKP